MNLLCKSGMAIFGLILATTAMAEKDPNKAAIEARQGEMQLRAFFAGPLFGMAKGKIPYDAEKAQMLADNLVRLIEIEVGDAWVPGTDKSAYPDNTDALAKIWTTYPEIGEYADKHDTAVKELAAVAGKGQDALKSKIGAVGKSCKNCHDDFREKD